MSPRIEIRHPGYKGSNLLFDFPACDGTNHDYAHYATVWLVCSILINNRQDHWLSTSNTCTGTLKVLANADGLLPAGEYYLHVPNESSDTTEPFPVVPNFRTWRFPHGNIPSLWHEASKNTESLAQKSNLPLNASAFENCRLTNGELENEGAHIIPAQEKPWFTLNEMGRYADLQGRSGETVADGLSNMIRLQPTPHRLWDKLYFTIVAMETDDPSREVVWHTQAINEAKEMREKWHRVPLQVLAGRPPEYLFARFAWNIFPRVYQFLQTGQKRRLVVWGQDGTFETREYTTAQCRQFMEGQGNSRSISPTKRARSKASSHADDQEPLSFEDDDHEVASSRPGHCSCSRSADSAVAGIRNNTARRSMCKNKPESEWSRYVRHREIADEDRGRKRYKTAD